MTATIRACLSLAALIAGQGCHLGFSTFDYGADGGGDGGHPPDASRDDAGPDASPDGGLPPDGGSDGGPALASPALTFPWLGYHGQRAPELQWEPVPGGLAYEVELTHGCAASDRESCGFAPGRTESTSTSETSWTPTGLLQLNTSAPRARTYLWRVRACSSDTRCSEWSAPRYFVYGSRNDLNGDGRADVLIGESSADIVHVFLGGDTASPWAISGISSGSAGGDRFGSSLAGLGDTNGDGYSDLIVGAIAEDYGGQIDPGRAYVLLGGPTVPTAATETLSLPTALNFVGFGRGAAAVGDINGDGFADLGVGADAIDGSTRPGAAYVYYGGPTGLTGPTVLRSPDLANQTGFGSRVLGIGDVNGDGFPDIAVSGPNARIGGVRTGKVWIYLGGGEGVGTTPHAEIQPPAGTVDLNGLFGGGLALSLHPPRLIVSAGVATPEGAPTDSGIVFSYRLDDFSLDQTITAEAPMDSERFGSTIGGAGDVNADGFDDILISVPRVRVELALLDGSGALSDRWSVTAAEIIGSVAGAGDVDLDGFDDVVVTRGDEGNSTLFRGAALGYAEPARGYPVAGTIGNQAP